jgi:hypothetical protein
MNLSEILRYAFLGTVVYGAYKLGEKNGKNENVNGGFAPHPKYYSEEDQILQEIELLRKKPNKTRRDRDNLSLLEIKLEQLYKFR